MTRVEGEGHLPSWQRAWLAVKRGRICCFEVVVEEVVVVVVVEEVEREEWEEEVWEEEVGWL